MPSNLNHRLNIFLIFYVIFFLLLWNLLFLVSSKTFGLVEEIFNHVKNPNVTVEEAQNVVEKVQCRKTQAAAKILN